MLPQEKKMVSTANPHLHSKPLTLILLSTHTYSSIALQKGAVLTCFAGSSSEQNIHHPITAHRLVAQQTTYTRTPRETDCRGRGARKSDSLYTHREVVDVDVVFLVITVVHTT